MTSSVSGANSSAMLTEGSATLKSAPSECPVSGESVRASIFNDILTDVAREPSFRDREKSDGEPSNKGCEYSVSTDVGASGFKETMPLFDASLFLISKNDETKGEPALTSTNAIRAAIPQSLLSTRLDVGSTKRPEVSSDLFAVSSPGPAPIFSPTLAEIAEVFPSRTEVITKEAISAAQTNGDTELLSGAFVNAADDKTENAIMPGQCKASAAPHSIATAGLTLAQPIHVISLETHLPAMMVRTALDLAGSEGDVESVTGGSASATQTNPVGVKILTFDVHPVALGSLTVRMRIIGKQIEIAIDVASDDVRAILTKTKTAMVDALAEHGLRLETPDIRLTSPTPTTSPTPEANEQNNQSDQSGFTKDQGYSHHGQRRPWNHHRSPNDEQSRKARSGLADAVMRPGLYL